MNRSNEFDLLLQLNRVSMSPKTREKTKHIKSPSLAYPIATEYYYARELSVLMKEFTDFALERIDNYLKLWFLDFNKDSFSDDFEKFNEEMEERLIAIYAATFALNSRPYNLLNNVSEHIYEHNKKEWAKQTKAVLGIPWSINPDWWYDVKDQWMRNNYLLMKKQGNDFVSTTQALIITAIQSLWTYPKLKESIQSLANKFVNNRTSFLARNEIGILNSIIWFNMYQEIGLDYYIWQTALDERVRGNPLGLYPKAIPSHFAMQGLIMNWKDSTVYSDDNGETWKKKTNIMEPLHVGMAMGCRCKPLPFWDNKINMVDKKLGG